MAGSSYKDDRDDAPITDINVTPFVDVVLVLLVVFIVTAKLIVSHGIEVDKPTALSGGEVTSALRLVVQPNGDLYVNNDKYDDDAKAIARIAEIAASSAKP